MKGVRNASQMLGGRLSMQDTGGLNIENEDHFRRHSNKASAWRTPMCANSCRPGTQKLMTDRSGRPRWRGVTRCFGVGYLTGESDGQSCSSSSPLVKSPNRCGRCVAGIKESSEPQGSQIGANRFTGWREAAGPHPSAFILSHLRCLSLANWREQRLQVRLRLDEVKRAGPKAYRTWQPSWS
jgi:hypothetical protein